MLFDEDSFWMVLAAQCERFGLLYKKPLMLAPNIFAAQIRQRDGVCEWSTAYYFDDREVKVRDKESGEQYMDREAQLLMAIGFMVGPILDREESHAHVAYFKCDMLGGFSANILNCATQFFARTDNGEIEWFERAEPINAHA